MGRVTVVSATVAALSFVACGGQPAAVSHVGSQQVSIQNATVLPPAPPPSTTGGFDGSRAYAHVRHLVDLGPRPPAARLGYDNVFINENYLVGGDDHFSFIRRGIAACDIIDFDVQTTYWHTPQDTLDKVDPRSLAIVGHVFLETVPELEMKSL
jgi:hypothetical protein